MLETTDYWKRAQEKLKVVIDSRELERNFEFTQTAASHRCRVIANADG